MEPLRKYDEVFRYHTIKSIPQQYPTNAGVCERYQWAHTGAP
jgi:hypothetical protein